MTKTARKSNRVCLKKYLFYGLFGLVIIYSLAIRVWKLGSVPAVINGDESVSMTIPWQILEGKVTAWQLVHDGSVPAVVYWPKTALIWVLGYDQSLLGARLGTVLMSICALIMLYLILVRHISRKAALLTVYLFASSYWYLNFSRLSWIAVDNVFFTLAFYYFFTKIPNGKRWGDVLLSGFFASMVFTNYMGGRIFLLVAAGYVWFYLVRGDKQTRKRVLLFCLIAGLFMIPMLITIATDFDVYMMRSSSVSIFEKLAGLEIGAKYGS